MSLEKQTCISYVKNVLYSYDNFDADEYRCLITIIYLKSVQLVLNNGKADKPNKEDAHIIIGVMQEIADIHAKNDSENKEIAAALNCLVEILI